MKEKVEMYFLKDMFNPGDKVITTRELTAETGAFRKKDKKRVCIPKNTKCVIDRIEDSERNRVYFPSLDIAIYFVPEYCLKKEWES